MEQMEKGIRKLVLAGIGAVAMTHERSEVVLNELIRRGELTVAQGKVLNEELKHNLKEALRESVTIEVEGMQDDLTQLLSTMDDGQLAALKQCVLAAEQMRSAQTTEEAPAEETKPQEQK